MPMVVGAIMTGPWTRIPDCEDVAETGEKPVAKLRAGCNEKSGESCGSECGNRRVKAQPLKGG